MEHLVKQYIDSRQLTFLWSHGGEFWYEDPMGRLIGLKQDGSTYIIAENFLNNSEFAGVNFAPDGKTLFVNIYSPTMTIAITGPWEEIA